LAGLAEGVGGLLIARGLLTPLDSVGCLVDAVGEQGGRVVKAGSAHLVKISDVFGHDLGIGAASSRYGLVERAEGR
jgi:hypothetical protein